ncbi:MAG: hypothetical protein GQ559_05445, partial [Desulfobulbaceae bacterium]|nr:hypothetical protein [Desulfobulbaceae bacterium]
NRTLPLPVHIRGNLGRLHVDKLDLDVKNFTVDLNGSDTTFTADMEQGAIYLQKTEENMTLAVTELDAEVLQPVIDFLDLKEGRLNFKAVGTLKNYEGWVVFNNVLLKDYAVLQNTLAFLDTIPALATFSSPGFDSEGYRIKDGVMHFTLNNDLLTVHNFLTDGETVNSQGSGWSDFKNRRLDVDLDLALMKNLSAIIDMIPLVGYAIQGEDGELTTSLKITGNMDQPDITTNLTEDIVLAPLNILQRTIAWPFIQLEKVIQNGSHPESN